MASQIAQQQHMSLVQPQEIHSRSINHSQNSLHLNTLGQQQRGPIGTSYLTLLGPHDSAATLNTTTRLGHISQPVHSKYINVTMNPYNAMPEDGTNLDIERDGMLATQYLRDSVYMNPKLAQLTSTLRRGKKVCQGGHMPDEHTRRENHGKIGNASNGIYSPNHNQNDLTMLPENEVVFRAVSPHGHVYWEIDPTRSQTINASKSKVDPCQQQNLATRASYVSDCTSPSGMESSEIRPTVLVNPFADINMIAQCQSPSKSSTSTNMTTDGSSMNASPAQLRNTKSFSRFNSPMGRLKSEDRYKAGTNGQPSDDTKPADVKSFSTRQLPQESCSYASNSASSSSTSTTSASSSLSTPSRPNDGDPLPQSITRLKDVKISISPKVSIKGKDFFLSKIQNHVVNGTAGMKSSDKQVTSLTQNMDSFFSSLSGSKCSKD